MLATGTILPRYTSDKKPEQSEQFQLMQRLFSPVGERKVILLDVFRLVAFSSLAQIQTH